MAKSDTWYMKAGKWTTAGAWAVLIGGVVMVALTVYGLRWAMGMGGTKSPANTPENDDTGENATGTGPNPPTPEQAAEWGQGVVDAWNQAKDWWSGLDLGGDA